MTIMFYIGVKLGRMEKSMETTTIGYVISRPFSLRECFGETWQSPA